jgi:hypothetical protein
VAVGFSIGVAGAIGRHDSSAALGYGGFVVALVAGALLARRPSRSHRDVSWEGSVRVEDVEIPALEIPYSNTKTFFALLVSLGMAEAFTNLAHGRWAVIIAAFAGLMALLAVLALVNLLTPPVVALSERGLHVSAGRRHRWVPWDEVEEVRLASVRGAPVLRVDAAHPAHFEGPDWARAIAGVGRRWGDMTIPLDVVGVDPEQLERTIVNLAKDPAARPGIAERGLS